MKVEACGMCHSDVFVKDGLWPGLAYPRVPGHEIAGHIDAVGDNVTAWRLGQRVGVGWHGGYCFVCAQCRRGDFAMCVHQQITGFDLDGGYAEYMIARVETLAAIPDALPAEEAGPFMCAGVTVYNALRHSGARAERAGDFCPGGRIVTQRHTVRAGRASGAVDDQCAVAHQWQAIGGRVAEAYDQMHSGRVRFRVVLTVDA